MRVFTKISNELFESNSVIVGKVSKHYIDKNYNLGGEASGDFTLLDKNYFKNKSRVFSNN